MEVLLQGHCVQEVCDYLRDYYCMDKQWIDLKLKESKDQLGRTNIGMNQGIGS